MSLQSSKQTAIKNLPEIIRNFPAKLPASVFLFKLPKYGGVPKSIDAGKLCSLIVICEKLKLRRAKAGCSTSL